MTSGKPDFRLNHDIGTVATGDLDVLDVVEGVVC